jgi:hypothetical protein
LGPVVWLWAAAWQRERLVGGLIQGDGITGTFGDGVNAAETSVDDRDLAEFDAARLERCPNCRCDADGRGNGDDCGNRHEESNLVGGFCTHASALSFSVSLTP